MKNKFTNVLYPDISVFIDETIAEKVIQKIVTPVQIASAINDVKKIENSAILNKQLVLMQVDIEKLNSSISFAQSLLERNLYYSKNQSDYDAAFASFYESIVTSYITSGLQPEIFYKILEIAHRTLLRSIAGFDEPTRIEIEKRASQVRAYVLNYAVQSMFNQLDPDLQIYKEIVNAGGKLFISINQSKTHSEIIENFAEYHAEALNVISKLLGVRSDVIKTLDKNLDDLKARLITSVNNETSNDSLINEYLIFFSEAGAIITQSINNDDNQVKISADILVLLNMQF